MDRNNPNSYYEFNDNDKEIKFKRHDTPTPWMNYFSNGTFTTMMSQAGGGVTFHKSPQIWRISRYKFFHIPTDRGGPYIYIKDKTTNQIWNPTFEPCENKLDQWNSIHGLGYTKFFAQKDGVICEVTYFIGEDENALIWNINLKNTTSENKNLEVYAFVELGMMEFMRELQWQCYNKHQLSVDYLNDIDTLIYTYGVEMQSKPDETPLVYFCADINCNGYDGDRDEFIGAYRSDSNPYAIENDGCTNSTLKGGDPQFAMQYNIELKKNSTVEFNVFMGSGMDLDEIRNSVKSLRTPGFVNQQFKLLNKSWDEFLNKYQVEIPDKTAQRMINVWNPYQAERNFNFSRNISYYATGTFRGVGYRDTAQDILAMIPFDTARSIDKIKLLLSQQYNDGHVNHYFFPNEGWEPVTRVHSDNHLWTIIAVYQLVMEQGDTSFLNEEVEYFDGGKGTIWQHLVKAIEFTKANLGANGFPLMLHSDWNDMLYKVCREGKGESIFVSQKFGLVCGYMAELAKLIDQPFESYLDLQQKQKELINTVAWDGEWFKRATMDSGEFLGSKDSEQAKIWLNTQSWAVMSGLADPEKCKTAMDNVKKYLDTPFGIKKIHPSMQDYPTKQDPLTYYNKGCGENGSVFCHANTWAIIAECMLGRGDIAYDYYSKLIPSNAMENVGAWRYKAEPYVYASNLFGPESDKPGLANVSWLTGTAAWMYVAITQYILGIRASWDGLVIAPCVPSDWETFSVKREFRGCMYNITFNKASKGDNSALKITVDGVQISGNVIPTKTEANECFVEVLF